MYTLRLWIGSIIFAIGVSFWVWFLRNLFRNRLNRAKLFVETNKLIIIFWNLLCIIVGLIIYPIPKTIPFLALIAGLLLGWSISRSSPHPKKTLEEPVQERDIHLERTEAVNEKFADCEWCEKPLDKRGRCPKCGPELRSKAPDIATKIGVNIEKPFEMAPSFRDRDDPDFLVVTILEAIEFITGEEIPIEETLNPLITEEVKRWYEQAWIYLNPIPVDD